MVYPPHESRPASRFDEAELERLSELEAVRRAAVRHDHDRRSNVVWVVAAILVLIASFMVAALMVSTIPRPGSEGAVRVSPVLTEASSGTEAAVPGRLDVLQTVDASPPPAPMAATGAASEGALGVPTTPTSAPEEASGTATYCAPTPRYCHGWGGRVRLGAVGSFSWGDRPYNATVCLRSDPDRCVVVRVVSNCDCGRTLIDLSPYAFTRLAPLWRGRIAVTLSVGAAIVPTLPPTDTR